MNDNRLNNTTKYSHQDVLKVIFFCIHVVTIQSYLYLPIPFQFKIFTFLVSRIFHLPLYPGSHELETELTINNVLSERSSDVIYLNVGQKDTVIRVN